MMTEHWIWWLLTMACMVWYCTITIYVMIKGSADIRRMLQQLADGAEREARESHEAIGGAPENDYIAR